MACKKTFKVELSEVELCCLLRYQDIRYYGGQYDLLYNVPKGLNWHAGVEAGIRRALRKIACQARKKWSPKTKTTGGVRDDNA